jgi:hypothetical protein
LSAVASKEGVIVAESGGQRCPKNKAEITYWNSAGGRRWKNARYQDIVDKETANAS